uniref:Nudix hydrolase domain-containing protein n=1 Tax=Skeletonema marinoi TaxID=267567 RepID=A0A7S2PF74_9STRA|mmetsp:Transcript_21012/g.35642  ORF Transcript_21012/g.35642 Transcript_21012/m.35642 type:complete len:789 (+) Transcript_21012:326-2692(+)
MGNKQSSSSSTTNKKWDGNAMSQNDFMERDTVLVLNNDDIVIGSESKKASHVFSTDQSRGVLHRAFSVCLFDSSTGEMLLQKRASTKITFPNVWTNTCCSHPLHGMEVNEVDGPEDVKDGSVKGVKAAAVRKLEHELGIPVGELPIENFKFLTRLHYWAADTVTHGEKSPWGEHEIDYVLFITVPSKDSITLKPHPDEVDDVCWVTQSKLLEMFADDDLLFSPWFRLIANRWMIGGGENGKGGWWDDLDRTMNTDDFCDYENIHRFDPPTEHLGGGGDAGPWLDTKEAPSANGTVGDTVGDASKKQGAYGKIKTHKESKLSQLMHIDEVCSAISLLYINPLKSNLESDNIKKSFDTDDLAFCDDILCKVSRSFAAVIRQLPSELLVDVLIFYLVLRALDTIEDDMTFFASNDEKVKVLLAFHKTALVDPEWKMMGCGEEDERRLLEEFPKCHSVFAALRGDSRRVISDITLRMATGMAEFVGKDLGQGTVDVQQYNRYCHFVAGLVGEGLSRLFSASGLEKPALATELYLSDQMGLFLQKTNIIRDYLEDYVDGRAFWPQTVWKKYSASGDLGYFANPATVEHETAALNCIDELVTDALELVPDCLSYLSKLRCAEVFRFCAIPQVMAIATLDKCYHNKDVFSGVVKIRKGMSCALINGTTDINGVHSIFHRFASSILRQAELSRKKGFEDPSYERTVKACTTILELTETEAKRSGSSVVGSTLMLSTAAVGCLTYKYPNGSNTTALTTAIASIGMFSLFKTSFMKYVGKKGVSSLMPASKLTEKKEG